MLNDHDVIAQAIKVINECFVGLMVTVDRTGMPYARWMGAGGIEGNLQRLFTLSGKQARKIEHLKHNPQVSWVFNTPNLGHVITLYGQARIMESPVVTQAVWDRLTDSAREYIMGPSSDDRHLEMVAIETRVERLELLSPTLRLYHPQTVLLHQG